MLGNSRLHVSLVWFWFLGVNLLIGVCDGGPTSAAEATPIGTCVTLPRPNDEVWVVNSRAAGCNFERLCYSRYHRGRWLSSSRGEFLASERPVKTVFYVHGLAISSSKALHEGWMVYRALAQQAAADEPFRLVIYSWPSDTGWIRPLRKTRAAARHADVDGRLLANLLSRRSSESQICLIGESSGARVSTTALHLLGGGVANGQTLRASSVPDQKPLRAVLVAGAVNNDWLLPGRPRERAVSQVDQMLVLFNPCDRILRWYRFLERGHCGPEAVGYTGIAGWSQLGDDRAKIRQVNASGYVGRRHVIDAYACSPSVAALIRPYAFGGSVESLAEVAELPYLPLPSRERAGVRGSAASDSTPHPNPLPQGEREQATGRAATADAERSPLARGD